MFVEPLIDLLVNVSVVARPTNVSVDVGSVNTPVFEIVAIVGEVKVKPATVVVVPPNVKVEEPNVIVLFANWALLIVPLKSVVGMVEDAVNADVPLPFT